MSRAKRIPHTVRVAKLKECPFCVLCHTTDDLELHHIDPKGPSTLDNLVVVCSKCHFNKWHEGKVTYRHADMVRAGIQEAKERGVHFGKKPADYREVMRLIAKHSTQFNNIYDADYELKTEHEIMDMAGVKEVCYYKCKRMLIEAINADKWPFEWKKPTICRNTPLYDRVIKRLRGDIVASHE